MRHWKAVPATIALLVLLAPAATATPLTVTWNGGIFGLEMLSVSGDGLTYLVRYTADLTDFQPDLVGPDHHPNQVYLTGVAFKIGVDPVFLSLAGHSASVQGAWTVYLDQWMNNNTYGCNGHGDPDGAICGDVAFADYNRNPTTGHSYWWDFLIVGPAGGTIAGEPIRADFVDANGNSATQLSLTTPLRPPIPEPATMLLVGAGLLGVGFLRRRR